MSREKTYEILNAISLGGLVAFLIFSIKWFLFFSIAILFVSIINEKLSMLIARSWMRFGNFIGTVNSKIILTLIFYLVLTPLAVIYRKFNKDKVEYFKNRKKQTFYIERNILFSKRNFEKMW